MSGREDLVGIDEYLPNALGMMMPLPSLAVGLQFLHILISHPAIVTDRKSAAERNWADGKANGLIIGTPTYLNDGIEFTSGASGLRTSMMDIYASSTLAIAGADVSPVPGSNALTRGFHIGSSAGTNDSNGANIYTSYNSSVVNVRANARYGTPSIKATLSTAGENNLLMGLRIAKFGSVTEDMSYKNMTTGAAATTDVPVDDNTVPYSRVLNGQPVMVGTEQSLAWGGKIRSAGVAGWSRVTTVEEDAAFYAWMKRLCATVALAV